MERRGDKIREERLVAFRHQGGSAPAQVDEKARASYKTYVIKADIQLGRHKKWEEVYRRIIEAVKRSEDAEDDNSNETAWYVVKYGDMYEEV